MAHIGSFVPAEASLIGLTDRIMTRIHRYILKGIKKPNIFIDFFSTLLIILVMKVLLLIEVHL